jgi:hypothetical protein
MPPHYVLHKNILTKAPTFNYSLLNWVNTDYEHGLKKKNKVDWKVSVNAEQIDKVLKHVNKNLSVAGLKLLIWTTLHFHVCDHIGYTSWTVENQPCSVQQWLSAIDTIIGLRSLDSCQWTVGDGRIATLE